MKKYVTILNVNIHNTTMDEAVNRTLEFLEDCEETQMIFTPNPEFVMLAQRDTEFREILNQGDLVVADGIGVVKAAKIIGEPLPERVAGYDLVQNIFDKIKNTNKTVYFFGAAPNVAEEAAKKMKEKYPGLRIIGTRNGYFKKEEENNIIQEINRLKPDLLLLGLGAPKQEKWIFEHRQELEVKVCMGIGGSFDVMSGQIKRAPKWMIKLNLEWFYRLLKQPTRFKRMLQLPLFLLKVRRSR